MWKLLWSGFRDEGGATAIEYSLIVTFIAVVIFASVQLVGPALLVPFTAVSSAF